MICVQTNLYLCHLCHFEATGQPQKPDKPDKKLINWLADPGYSTGFVAVSVFGREATQSGSRDRDLSDSATVVNEAKPGPPTRGDVAEARPIVSPPEDLSRPSIPPRRITWEMTGVISSGNRRISRMKNAHAPECG